MQIMNDTSNKIGITTGNANGNLLHSLIICQSITKPLGWFTICRKGSCCKGARRDSWNDNARRRIHDGMNHNDGMAFVLLELRVVLICLFSRFRWECNRNKWVGLAIITMSHQRITGRERTAKNRMMWRAGGSFQLFDPLAQKGIQSVWPASPTIN